MDLYLATAQGIAVCGREAGAWRVRARALAGQDVTSVAAREGVILAGTTRGVFHSDDGGSTWREASRGLKNLHLRWLAYHPEGSGLAFAGTEPANLYVSHDGETWRECAEVAGLRDEHRWSLPYSPEAGCVRGFALHGNRGYAAVEVGGLLRSDDRGETWRLAEGSDGKPDLDGPPAPLIYPDVHSIEVHPSSADRLFAPTGGGFYTSSDGGRTWQLYYDCYCRAVWVDPQDARHLILGPADGVERNGRIEATHDGGATWEPASAGLQVPWARGMVERFHAVPASGDPAGELLAILANGELLSTPISALSWQRILPEVTGVQAAASAGLI